MLPCRTKNRCGRKAAITSHDEWACPVLICDRRLGHGGKHRCKVATRTETGSKFEDIHVPVVIWWMDVPKDSSLYRSIMEKEVA